MFERIKHTMNTQNAYSLKEYFFCVYSVQYISRTLNSAFRNQREKYTKYSKKVFSGIFLAHTVLARFLFESIFIVYALHSLTKAQGQTNKVIY